MAMGRTKRNAPDFLKRDKIHQSEIDPRKKSVRNMRTVKEDEFVIIERHDLPPVMGWHTGEDIQITHQFNPKTKHFEPLETIQKNTGYNWDRRITDIKKRGNITMPLDKNGNLKYPTVAKKIWKFKE